MRHNVRVCFYIDIDLNITAIILQKTKESNATRSTRLKVKVRAGYLNVVRLQYIEV